ncbi:MAG: PssD/Cps14F family polysaccharide biosynthesis glycosyltransferase [Thermodesulfobacteriota bacterium]
MKIKKIGLVCSHGGHFTQMLQLMEAFEGFQKFILTYRETTTKNQKDCYYIENIFRSPMAFIKGVIKIFMILLKERPDVLFSTGSEIAAPAFYIGKIFFRSKLIYLESAAQVFSPSLTGKFVYPITDLFLVQWEPLLKRYGPKAKYVGGLI